LRLPKRGAKQTRENKKPATVLENIKREFFEEIGKSNAEENRTEVHFLNKLNQSLRSRSKLQ